VTQPLGQTVRYEWDPRDRLAKKILARSSTGGSSEHPEIRYTYETWGPLQLAKHFAKSSDTTPLKTITYARDLAGDLTSVTDDSIQSGPLYTYEVDKLGRTARTFAKYIPGGDRRLDYAYDARGDLVTFTLNEPNEVLAHVYTYAADSGRIATALFPGESTALVIARWPHDGVKSIDYPGGVRREVDYDVRGAVSEIRIKPPAGTPLIEKWTYTYTDVLNVATMTDGASRQTAYQYDALDRLTQADHPTMPPPLDSLPDVENFTYDGVGDRTMTGYAHDANHRMRASPGHTYDYDDDGNLVVQDPNAPGQVSFSWDKSDRLSSYTSTSIAATYDYDPFGRRIRSTSSGVSTWSLWRGDLLATEYAGSGQRTTRFAHAEEWAPHEVGLGPSVSTESRLFAGNDRLDAPRLLVGAAGSVQWRATYAAFGTAFVDPDPDGDSQATTFNTRLPGQQFDADSGLHYNRFRTFDSETGRYISPDPDWRRLLEASLYQYANSDPTNLIDPLGLHVTISITRDSYGTTSVGGTLHAESDKTGNSVDGFTDERTFNTDPSTGVDKPMIDPGTYDASLRTDHTPARVELENVPDYTNVQIHTGNSTKDVIGCFAYGPSRAPIQGDPNALGYSSKASNELLQELIQQDGSGGITVIVVGPNNMSLK
jgi:RHS repeat-associated protein